MQKLGQNRIYHLFLLLMAMVIGFAGLGFGIQPVSAQGQVPNISILSVNQGQSVTIQGQDFPGNRDFQVLMGEAGTQGTNGTQVATITTPASGNFVGTFNIPQNLANNQNIVIRLESTAGGFFAYRTFANSGQGGGAQARQCSSFYTVQAGDTLAEIAQNHNTTVQALMQLNNLASPSGIFIGQQLCLATQGGVILPPTGANANIAILKVNRGQSVTISATGFPVNQSMLVLMGQAGTSARTGFQVARVSTPQSGNFVATFNIPQQLQDNNSIVLRLESETTSFFATETFQNRNFTATAPANCTQFYTVQRGDTLSEIAQRFNTTTSYLATLNNIQNPSLIFPGNRICVSVSGGIILPPTGANPNITVTNVNANNTIAISGAAFPANTTLNILIAQPGNQGVGGMQVDTVTTNNQGSFTDTVTIPEQLLANGELVVRAQNANNNAFAFATFMNPAAFQIEGLNLPAEPFSQSQANLNQGERTTVSSGNSGVFIPNSADNGTLVVSRYSVPIGAEPAGLSFAQNLTRVQVLSGSQNVEQARGLVYVFFDLTDTMRSQYQAGNLNIYYFNPDKNTWEPCQIQVPIEDNGQVSRLACVIQNFGVYGIATPKGQ